MKTILIVEDNAANMKLATMLLRKAGYAVLGAGNAEDGIAIARAEPPDLVLMDIQLPGMDGLEATRLLKGDPATRAIPVVALTAHAMKGDDARILEVCDGYIAKPLRYKEFLAEVEKQLGGKGNGSGL